jgi:hypothetical protein
VIRSCDATAATCYCFEMMGLELGVMLRRRDELGGEMRWATRSVGRRDELGGEMHCATRCCDASHMLRQDALRQAVLPRSFVIKMRCDALPATLLVCDQVEMRCTVCPLLLWSTRMRSLRCDAMPAALLLCDQHELRCAACHIAPM